MADFPMPLLRRRTVASVRTGGDAILEHAARATAVAAQHRYAYNYLPSQ
jgi:hypothetical protein